MIQYSDYTIQKVNTPEDKVRFTRAWFAVWQEEGYVPVNENVISKYAQFDTEAIDYLLLSRDNQVAGTLRIIAYSPTLRLPTLNDFELYQKVEHAKVCEATLLTVSSGFRGIDSVPLFLLLITLWRFVREHNYQGILVAADFRLWFILTKKLKLVFTQIGKGQLYEGSMTIPGYLSVEEQKQRALTLTPRNIFEEALKEI